MTSPATDEMIAASASEKICADAARRMIAQRFQWTIDPRHILAVCEAAASLRTRLEAAERERDVALADLHGMQDGAAIRDERARADHWMGRAEAAEKRADRYKDVLTVIAHTFTEDSHGNMKTLPAHDYQQIALDALSKQEER